jgi:hypothetical protein
MIAQTQFNTMKKIKPCLCCLSTTLCSKLTGPGTIRDLGQLEHRKIRMAELKMTGSDQESRKCSRRS